jgi:hypothetical protein
MGVVALDAFLVEFKVQSCWKPVGFAPSWVDASDILNTTILFLREFSKRVRCSIMHDGLRGLWYSIAVRFRQMQQEATHRSFIDASLKSGHPMFQRRLQHCKESLGIGDTTKRQSIVFPTDDTHSMWMVVWKH